MIIDQAQEQRRVGKMEAAIKMAKEIIEQRFEGDTSHREWMKVSPPDILEDPLLRVELHVLPGYPPVGYILADHCSGVVKAYGMAVKHIRTYYPYHGRKW